MANLVLKNGGGGETSITADKFLGSSTSSKWLEMNSNLTYGASGLQYFNSLNLNTSNSATANSAPNNDWWHIIRLNHANRNGYFTDIATSLNSLDGLYWRQVRHGSAYGWYRCLDTYNYNSYAPTLTGNGTSGTWNINISGTAATASSIAWANITGKPSTYPPDSHNHDSLYVNVSGDTMSGPLVLVAPTTSLGNTAGTAQLFITQESTSAGDTFDTSPRIGFHSANRYWGQLVYHNGFHCMNGANLSTYTSIKASTFIGNLNGTADNSNLVGGFGYGSFISGLRMSSNQTGQMVISNASGSEMGRINLTATYAISADSASTWSEKRVWNAYTQAGHWSRLCHINVYSSTSGLSAIMSLQATRNNVVYNVLFTIISNHSSGYSRLTILNNSVYTPINLRLVNDSNGNCYVELYETGAGNGSGTYQTVYCTLLPMLIGGCTCYTSYTSGSSIPSGYSIGSSIYASGSTMQADAFCTRNYGSGPSGSPAAGTIYYKLI